MTFPCKLPVIPLKQLGPHLALGIIQVLSLVSSLGAQMMLGHTLGPGRELDFFFSALGVASSFVGGVAVAATYLVPARIHLHGSGPTSKRVIAGESLVGMGLAGLLLALVGLLVVDVEGIQGLDAHFVKEGNWVITFSWLAAMQSVLSATFAAIGSAHKSVTLPMALSTLPQLATILYLGIARDPHLTSLAAAQLTGVTAQVCFLGRLYSDHWSLGDIKSRGVRQVVVAIPMAVFGTVCFSGYSAIDAVLAPLIGPGVMSHQALSQRLVIAFSSVLSAGSFMLAPSRSSLLLKGGQKYQVWEYLCSSVATLVLCCWLAAVFTSTVGIRLIELLFQRGGFGPADSEAVSSILSVLLIGAGPMLATAMVFRVMHNLDRHNEVALISICWLVLYSVLSWYLISYVGELSLSLSYALAWILMGFLSLARARYLLR